MRLILATLFILCSYSAQADEVASTVAPSEKVALSEAEIPLTIEAPKKATSAPEGFSRILMTGAMIAILGGGALWAIKKYSVPSQAKAQTQIKVLQQHYLGPKKSLAIIRVAGESILIGVTDTNISLIKSLALLDDDIPEANPTQFKMSVDSEGDELTMDEKSLKDDFRISDVKDVVTKRISQMRSL